MLIRRDKIFKVNIKECRVHVQLTMSCLVLIINKIEVLMNMECRKLLRVIDLMNQINNLVNSMINLISTLKALTILFTVKILQVC